MILAAVHKVGQRLQSASQREHPSSASQSAASVGDKALAAMSAGDLTVCFDEAQKVINGSLSLAARDILVASLVTAADAAEEKLVRMANETRAAFHAAEQVGLRI